MYRAPIPKTKLLSPYPAARFSGEVDRGRPPDRARRLARDGRVTTGAPSTPSAGSGCTGSSFEGADDAWLDVGLGRIKIGPVTTPWIGNGALFADGELFRLGGPSAARRTAIDERPDGCRFAIPGRGVLVRGEVGAPGKDFVGWVYSDPDGSEHNTVNCSIASMELTVERPGALRRIWSALTAPRTSSACARPTTASRSSRSRTR